MTNDEEALENTAQATQDDPAAMEIRAECEALAESLIEGRENDAYVLLIALRSRLSDKLIEVVPPLRMRCTGCGHTRIGTPSEDALIWEQQHRNYGWIVANDHEGICGGCQTKAKQTPLAVGLRVREANCTYLAHEDRDRAPRSGVLLALCGPMARVHWDGTFVDLNAPGGEPSEWVNHEGWLFVEEPPTKEPTK